MRAFIASQISSFCLAVIPILAKAQMTVQVSSVPQLTPLLDDLFITGTFNDWDPGDPLYRMTPTGTGAWTVSIPGTNGEQVSYKFTRGTWDMVEGGASGNFIPNRNLVYSTGGLVSMPIAGWEDLQGTHTVTPNVFILDTDFAVPQLGRTRRIWICLPSDYATSESHYPVWYMHDGQNLFSNATSFSGEWQIDEAMSALASTACRSIIVGIDNGQGSRINEYAPWYNAQHQAGGEGAQFSAFIVNTLKPLIDERFRTLPGREHTCTGGSSLGGLISLYMMLEYPQVFSRAAILSPAFWFNYNELLQLIQSASLPADSRVHMIAGQNESPSMVPNMNSVRDALIAAGVPASNVTSISDPSGAHSEWWWAQVFPGVYNALAFCGQTQGIEDPLKVAVRVYPNPARDSVTIDPGDIRIRSLQVLDATGKLIYSEDIRSPSGILTIPCGAWPSGVYVVRIQSQGDEPSIQNIPFIRE